MASVPEYQHAKPDILSDANVAGTQVQLCDLNGSGLYSSSWWNNHELDIVWKQQAASLPNGVYWALTHTQDQNGVIHDKIQKFIVKR